MIAIKSHGRIKKINLTIEVLVLYISLVDCKSLKNIKVDKTLCSLLKVRNCKKNKQKITKELNAIISIYTLDELYNKAAEIGILQYFFSLTPKEIEDAYQGHLQSMYNYGNLYILAEKKSRDIECEPFTYIAESEVTREETLKALGMR